jgi:hypothetical protein
MSKASTTMKQLQMSPGEMAQISTLISNLTRSVELLHFDIDFEEERARIRDLSDPSLSDPRPKSPDPSRKSHGNYCGVGSPGGKRRVVRGGQSAQLAS